MAVLISPESLGVGAAQLKAPLYVAWQLTNECNLSCRHCIEESGPGQALGDGLSRDEVLRIADEIIAAEVPYVALSGGEPLLHPNFFEVLDRFQSAGVGVKIETNAQLLTSETISRLSLCGVRSIQVSLDGVCEEAYAFLRPGAKLSVVLDGIRDLKRAGLAVEANFAPTRRSVGQIAETVDLAYSLKASAFYTGRLMRAGRAVPHWGLIAPNEEQYARFFKTLKAKALQYEGRMRVCWHELGLARELRWRLDHPAALFILLPDGKVKLINALPFICGDLRRQSLAEVWRNYQRAWKDPRVVRFIAELSRDESLVGRLHERIEL